MVSCRCSRRSFDTNSSGEEAPILHIQVAMPSTSEAMSVFNVFDLLEVETLICGESVDLDLEFPDCLMSFWEATNGLDLQIATTCETCE